VLNLAKAVHGAYLIVGDINKERRHVRLKDMKKNIAVVPSMKYILSEMKSTNHKVQPDALMCYINIPLTSQYLFPLIPAQCSLITSYLLASNDTICQILYLCSHCLHQICGLKEVLVNQAKVDC